MGVVMSITLDLRKQEPGGGCFGGLAWHFGCRSPTQAQGESTGQGTLGPNQPLLGAFPSPAPMSSLKGPSGEGTQPGPGLVEGQWCRPLCSLVLHPHSHLGRWVASFPHLQPALELRGVGPESTLCPPLCPGSRFWPEAASRQLLSALATATATSTKHQALKKKGTRRLRSDSSALFY